MKSIKSRTMVKLLTAYRAKGMSLGGAYKRIGKFTQKHGH